VSPIIVARQEEYKVLFSEFKDEFSNVLGFLSVGTKTIYVNSDTPPCRQMFAIAHELGHAILHANKSGANSEYSDVFRMQSLDEAGNPDEIEANTFAANLLAPAKFLDIYRHASSVSELSRIFVVSEEVIRRRLKSEYLQT
jgi:Zn-dependent peptidase ImmA (M78 family)